MLATEVGSALGPLQALSWTVHTGKASLDIVRSNVRSGVIACDF